MRIERTEIAEVDLIHWDRIADDRGSFVRTFCEAELAAGGRLFRVVQANLSRNTTRHTLRGMHYQRDPHGEPKIVSCPRGRIFDVAVDVRADSPTFRRWIGLELGEACDRALLLGTGIAHGFLTLEPDSEVEYLMGAPYVPEAATGIRWDDPLLDIDWPARPVVISPRDAGYALLEDRP